MPVSAVKHFEGIKSFINKITRSNNSLYKTKFEFQCNKLVVSYFNGIFKIFEIYGKHAEIII